MSAKAGPVSNEFYGLARALTLDIEIGRYSNPGVANISFLRISVTKHTLVAAHKPVNIICCSCCFFKVQVLIKKA